MMAKDMYIGFSSFILLICQQLTLGDFPFRNTSLSWDQRVDDLVSRLTLEEVVEQMSRGGAGTNAGPAPAIDRLKIGPYQWDTECLRGDVQAGNATSFPQAIGLAAAFSYDLIFNISQAASIEARAKHTDFVKRKIFSDHTGLSCFSPVINIMRHPLWGRNQETYGEDPYLSGIYALNFVQGLQGDNDRYVRASAGCKHFDVHGGPEDKPVSRFGFNAKVTERDLALTFLPAFHMCVKGGSYSVMCSYNSVNGVPSCANKALLTDVLRDGFGFQGYVVSDQGAIENMIIFHKYFNNSIDAATGAVEAGCNLELSSNLKNPVFLSLVDAVKKGKLNETLVRNMLKPLFYTRMRLGEFDPPDSNPYSNISLSVIQSPAHQYLALSAAAKSFVLLKHGSNNFGSRLLLQTTENIAVLGPMANNSEQMFGDYSPTVDPKFVKTPLQSLSEIGLTVNYAAGCLDGNRCTNYSQDDIKTALNGANVVVVCLGTGQEIESEGRDRVNMELPGKQLQLLQDVVNIAKLPVYLVLFNAGPVNITWAEENEYVEVILECFYPAQASGEAIKQTLLAKDPMFNPAGRLPFTWPKTADQIPSMTDYSMVGKTYRYFTGEPLYPFGYGLSYSKFSYSDLKVPLILKAGNALFITCVIGNLGPMDGDEVAQVYISWPDTKEKMPQLQLAAFQRIFIPYRETKTVSLAVTADSMAVWNEITGYVVEPGRLRVYVGGQQPFQKKSLSSNILQVDVEIQGQIKLGKNFKKKTKFY